MKRGQIIEIKIEEIKFPSVGIGYYEKKKIKVKNATLGQIVKIRISKNRSDVAEGKVLEVIEKSDIEVESFCEHFGSCGGCLRQTIPYDEQLKIKMTSVKKLLDEGNISDYIFEDIIGSPEIYEYRNKMEYSFGDEEKGGILNLGMHKKGRYHDVVTTDKCKIVDEDYNIILSGTLEFFRNNDVPKYNKNSFEGFLRQLVIRKSKNTKEILVGLSGNHKYEIDDKILSNYVDMLKKLELNAEIVGILFIKNDGIADMVQGEIEILFGREYYMEELMGLKFKVSFYSFFQTNPVGAEVLYKKAMEYTGSADEKTVFDLFSGTGTIGQIASKNAKKVIGIEIIEDAVRSANENAELNCIENCTFIAGDVFEVLDNVREKPDVIIVDPPRAGIMEKTLGKILDYKVDQITYISCNPKTLVDNLVFMEKRGYKVERVCCVDMFPHTGHVETCVSLKKIE